MTNDHPHLTADAAALLSEPQAGRIRAIRSRRWILYPRAKLALDRLEALLDHPRGPRMPSVAIYGDSGMGKTMIMQRFRDQHPPHLDRRTGILKTPVLAMEMVSRPENGGSMANCFPSSARPRHRGPILPRWNRRPCGS